MSVFYKQGDQWVVKQGVSDNASINDCAKAMGYEHNQFYSYTNYNQPYDYDTNSDGILCVCLKVMTEDIICVVTNPGRTTLTDAEVRRYMQDFNFSFDYSLYTMESDLDEAIAEHNYSIRFVAEALGIPYSPDDKILYSSKFKYNFIFEGGYLVGYEIADSYNREAHELKDSGSWLFQKMESHAERYHGSNDDVIREINIQAKAFYNLPAGMNNQFLPEFVNADDSYNFKMLLVAKYEGTENEEGINYDDCKCICHNELKFDSNVDEGLDKLTKYRYREYILTFDDKGNLRSCEYNQNSSSTNDNHQESKSLQPSSSGCMVTLMSAICIMTMAVAAIIVIL